ncbi:MAG: hypothetical protein WAQ41_09120 [bacterium]|jgi:hypothetical protein|nr:hypothetical protein [Bacillota bacterium]HHW55746.1 hypothetical protein [Bacillota bacterium]
MELRRRINGREYIIEVELEPRNAPAKRWVAYCSRAGFQEEVGRSPTEAVRKLERRILTDVS